jgi:hypothetical protein
MYQPPPPVHLLNRPGTLLYRFGIVLEKVAMAQLQVIGALSNKRAELAGIVRQLEQQLAQQRTNLSTGCAF